MGVGAFAFFSSKFSTAGVVLVTPDMSARACEEQQGEKKVGYSTYFCRRDVPAESPKSTFVGVGALLCLAAGRVAQRRESAVG